VTPRGCGKISSVGDSQLTVLVIQKTPVLRRKTLYTMFSKRNFWFAELILEIRGCFHLNMCLTLSSTCLRSLCVTLNVLKSVHRITEYFLVETLEAIKIVIFYVSKKNIIME